MSNLNSAQMPIIQEQPLQKIGLFAQLDSGKVIHSIDIRNRVRYIVIHID
jgi:hypothetical protein